MKKLYLIFVLPLFVLPAAAQERENNNILDKLIWDDKMLNIMLDGRVDGLFTTGNSDGDEWGFRGQTFKLVFSGEILPGLRYRVRHRLNKPVTPAREGFSSATDQAWLAFDFGCRKQWTVTVGKQSVQFGTFEYDYNPADIYQGTMMFNDLDAYKTGVEVAYRFAGQTLHLQLVNSDSPQFASEEYKNKALALNFMWEGSLWRDAIRTRWGYGAFQHTSDKIYSWVTLGIQANAGGFTGELDYYFGDRNIDFSSVVGAAAPRLSFVRDQSLSLNLKYNFGKWRPFVKGTWDNRFDKDTDSDAYQTLGIEGGVEFYPFTNPLLNDLRFHLVYAYNDTAFKGAFSDLRNSNRNMVVLGLRWLLKVK